MKDELCLSDVDYNSHIFSHTVSTPYDGYPILNIKIQEVGQVRVMVVQPSGVYDVREIEGKLQEYQRLVDGYIEAIPFLPVSGAMAIVDEEGKLKRKPPNIFLCDRSGKVVDLLVGTIVFVGQGFESLTDEQVAQIQTYIDEELGWF